VLKEEAKFKNLLSSLATTLSKESDGEIGRITERLEVIVSNDGPATEEALRVTIKLLEDLDVMLLARLIDAENRVGHLNHLRHGIELLQYWGANRKEEDD